MPRASGVIHDLRGGLRLLYKSPWLATMAILTLGLGIAVNTAVFSWVDSVLLRPIPGAEAADRLVAIEEIPSTGQTPACAYPDFRDFQKGADLLSGLAAWHMGSFAIGSDRNARRVYGQIVSANYFSVLRVKPFLGRSFTSGEDRDAEAAYPYAVVSHRLWASYFGADAGVLGQAVRVNGRPITIIGVAPPEFRGTATGLAMDLWVHLSMIHEMGGVGNWPVNDRNAKPLVLIGRLGPGVTLGQANAQITALAARMAAAHPATHAGTGAIALPVWKSNAGAQAVLRSPLRILLAITVLVLMIACANVANLLLARSVSRQKEFATRLALGARRGQIVRQLLIESAVLAAPAVGVGLLLTLWLGQGLASLAPETSLPLAFVDVEINGRMLAFASAACALAAAASGLAPALYASRADLRSALQNVSRGSSAAASSHRARSLLVITEVALASLALIGAGLFVRSFQKLSAIRLGFDPDGVHAVRLYLASAGYSAEQERQFCRTLQQRLQGVAGVEAASYSIEVPLAQGGDESVQIEGYLPRSGESMVIPRNNIGPEYFRLLRIPLLAGREFTDRDDRKAPRVAIVNETFAHRFFPDADPIGRRMKVALSKQWFTVVGVVKDSKYASPTEEARPYFYAPFQQMFASGHDNFFYLRTANTAQGIAALRNVIGGIDGTSGLYEVEPLKQRLRTSLYAHFLAASLMGALGILALALAAVGLYCVMAYAVSERTQEIGIRMALGAKPAHVLGMVLRQAMGLASAGLLVGGAAALAAGRFLGSMLVGISGSDAVSYAGAAVLLCLVSLVASYVPAWRATRVAPSSALRCN